MDHGIEQQDRLLYSKDPLEQNQVAGTADGQKLGDTLNRPQDQGFKNSHVPTIAELSFLFKAAQDSAIYSTLQKKTRYI
jgi:hypothetical protein